MGHAAQHDAILTPRRAASQAEATVPSVEEWATDAQVVARASDWHWLADPTGAF